MMDDTPRNHVREFAGVRLAARIAAEPGLPAFVDNDANALALAEWTFGVGRGASSIVLLAVGTEVGGAIIFGDTLVRGHAPSPVSLATCRFISTDRGASAADAGCAGAYLGGRVIARSAQRRAARVGPSSSPWRAAIGAPSRRRWCSKPPASTIRSPARSSTRRARRWPPCLTIAVNGINPEVVVVTGGVAASLAPLAGDILRRAGRYAFASALTRTRVEMVSGEKSRTVRGGAALVLYELRRSATRSARESYNAETRRERTMPKYVIEREIPGVGSWSADKLQAASTKSVAVLKELGPDIQWIESYVTGDRLYCVYIAPGEELIRTHASKGGFPVTRISKVATQIDPTTAEK